MDTHIVFFDGDCGLCNRTVNWLLKKDLKHQLMFAPIGGLTYFQFFSTKPGIQLPDSIIFLDGEDVYLESKAVFKILELISAKIPGLKALDLLPVRMTDLAYRLIAKHRHRFFQNKKHCNLPSAETRKRFLP